MINYYHTGEGKNKMKDIFSIVESSPDETTAQDVGNAVNVKIKNDPVVQLVDHIIQEGINLNCSDIHLEVYEKKFRVRYRVDGHLAEHFASSRHYGGFRSQSY